MTNLLSFLKYAKYQEYSVDCDIKDKDNDREVKLFKSKPVAQNENVIVSCSKKETKVTRKDGSLIVKIEQLELDNTILSEFGPVKKNLDGFPPTLINDIIKKLKAIKIDAVIQITGDFFAGQNHLILGEDSSNLGGGNLMIGTGGIRLSDNSISM